MPGSQPGTRPSLLSVLDWRKSSQSLGNGNCVEVAHLGGGNVSVRDGKDSAGPVLRFTPGEWTVFLAGVREGGFDGLVPGWRLVTWTSVGGGSGRARRRGLGFRVIPPRRVERERLGSVL